MSDRPKLTLVSQQDLTAAEIYGIFFNVLTDEMDAVKERALYEFKLAREAGVRPAAMKADFALEELGLATRTNVTTVDGMPVFEYLGDDDGLCDCDEFYDDDSSE